MLHNLPQFSAQLRNLGLINVYNFFILEVLKAHVATALNKIRTLHYRGKGIFITSGELVNKRQKFTKWKDSPNF